MKKSAAAVNFEYFALRAACALVNAMPYRMAAAVARFAARSAARVFGYRRKRTLERIESVFPGIGREEALRIAEESLENVALTAVEMIRAPHLTKKWMDRHILNGQFWKDRLQEYVNEGKGVVVMVPHSGNWYMAAWSMAKYGLPLVSIAAKQRNPKINAWMKRQYGEIEVLERGSSRVLVEIKRRLEAGRVFAILPDLRVPQKDVEVDFLGGKANVSHAGAMFAVKCGSPIVVAMMRREKGMHVFDHITTLRPDPAAADAKAEAARLTREAMKALDERVRKHPGQWFWYNKRWILQPV